ncbi:MAG: hypothetical protein MJ252_09150 [archaeon]|nr:hypothetical protein [archaeon]
MDKRLLEYDQNFQFCFTLGFCLSIQRIVVKLREIQKTDKNNIDILEKKYEALKNSQIRLQKKEIEEKGEEKLIMDFELKKENEELKAKIIQIKKQKEYYKNELEKYNNELKGESEYKEKIKKLEQDIKNNKDQIKELKLNGIELKTLKVKFNELERIKNEFEEKVKKYESENKYFKQVLAINGIRVTEEDFKNNLLIPGKRESDSSNAYSTEGKIIFSTKRIKIGEDFKDSSNDLNKKEHIQTISGIPINKHLFGEDNKSLDNSIISKGSSNASGILKSDNSSSSLMDKVYSSNTNPIYGSNNLDTSNNYASNNYGEDDDRYDKSKLDYIDDEYDINLNNESEENEQKSSDSYA